MTRSSLARTPFAEVLMHPAAIAAAYTLFFAALFLQFPIAGALPGNCDTWLNGIALPNAMLARLLAGFDLDQSGISLYPERSLFAFGESAFGTSSIFVLWKLLTWNDVWATYLFVVTIFSLDALVACLLAGCWVRSRAAAAFAGLAFAASNYTLANIDSPHSSFFFVAFLALWQLQRHIETGRRRQLFLAALLGGAQAWFSAYVFLFMTGAAAILVLAGLRRRPPTSARGGVRAAAAAMIVFLLVSAPFFASYALARRSANFSNPWNSLFLAEIHSLEPADLLRTLERNILYPLDEPVRTEDLARRTRGMIERGDFVAESLTSGDAAIVMGTLSGPGDVKFFVGTRRCAFAGLVLYGLAVLGVAATRRWELAFIYGAFALLSFGPYVEIGGRLLPAPSWPAYHWIEAAALLRVPSRAFSFALLGLAVAAGLGLERLAAASIFRNRGRRLTLFTIVTLAMLAENVPFPMKAFAGERLATPEPLVRAFFEGRRGSVLVDLPSRPGGALYGDGGDLFEWNRELIYMNRQTYHRQNTVNGVHGYFPLTRLRIQEMINALPSAKALAGLQGAGVDYLVYHHALELPWEQGLFDAVSSAPELEVVASSPEVTILGWRPAAARGSGV